MWDTCICLDTVFVCPVAACTARCAGVVYDAYVIPLVAERWKQCRKIVGVETVGVFLRSMTRADVSNPFRLTFPFP